MKRAQLIRISASAMNLASVCEIITSMEKFSGPELDLNCLQRLSVEHTLASEDRSVHLMAAGIISLILRRAYLAPHIYLSFFFSFLSLYTAWRSLSSIIGRCTSSISVHYYIFVKYKCTFTASLAAV